MSAPGRPKEYDEDRTTKAVRVSPELNARLKAAARERGVSANLLMNIAIEEYLDRMPPIDKLRTA